MTTHTCPQCNDSLPTCEICQKFYQCMSCGLDICDLCYGCHPLQCGLPPRSVISHLGAQNGTNELSTAGQGSVTSKALHRVEDWRQLSPV